MLKPLVNFRAIMPGNTRERYIDDFFNDTYRRLVGDHTAEQGNMTIPGANIQEVDQGYQIEIAIPGFKRSDFKIEVNQGILTISGERKMMDEKKDSPYTRQEFNYVRFNRSFTLPDNVMDNKITARYTDGILNVRIPVEAAVEEAHTPKQIAVS